VSELDELRLEVRRLADREAIRDVFATFAAAMDGKDWSLLATVWTEDAVYDHSAFTWDGLEEVVWHGRDDIMRRTIEGVSRHAASHHIVSNHRMRVEGDRARAVVYLHSVHLDDAQRADEHGDHGAWYFAELARGEGGWKIRWLAHQPVWYAGQLRPRGPITDAVVARVRDFLGP
jgi:ketosteroid isomerase-like protein